ncbi:MAG: PLP-dependent aminotransferase family protein [Haliea sp.]|nr:MAG: PLP-dependent aminotransferase family protein [Haliea sp.]
MLPRWPHPKNTVVAVFELLVSRGIVEPRRGSGYYVLAASGAVAPEEEAGSLGRAMDIVWLMREQLKWEADQLSVGDGFPPVEWLAGARLDKYHHKVVRTGLGALFRYGSRFGYEPLRHHLVRKLADLGIGAEPRQIVLTHGANEAMDIVIRYFVPPGGTVLADDPGYYPLFGKLKLASARIVGVPRLADGPDLDALEQLLITHRPRLFFTQSVAHNPTGSDLSAAKAFRVLQLAEKYDLLLVENDPLADFKPMSMPRLSALDQLDRTIYIGSFSKSFSAALRVGFIACGADLASDLADLKALTEATAKAVRIFDSVGSEVFARPPQTLYLWAALPGVPDSLKLAQEMLSEKIVSAPGKVFCVDGSQLSKWSRFNVGAVGDPRFARSLKAVLRRMG